MNFVHELFWQRPRKTRREGALLSELLMAWSDTFIGATVNAHD